MKLLAIFACASQAMASGSPGLILMNLNFAPIAPLSSSLTDLQVNEAAVIQEEVQLVTDLEFGSQK